MIEYLDMQSQKHYLNPDQVLEFEPRVSPLPDRAYIVLVGGDKIPTQTPLSDLVSQFNAERAQPKVGEKKKLSE